MNDAINILQERGYIHQCSDLQTLSKRAEPFTAYVGFDCTAPSLHIGHLSTIMMLRILQKTGHRPIVLMGGGTTQIGDPSGKDETRQLLSKKTIKNNINSLKTTFGRFLDFGDEKALLLDNAAWLENLDYIGFLRDYGRFFSVNRMLTFDSVRLRLERHQPLSFLEFNYMLLQAYDFLELYKNYDCILQMGGADQWGNIVNGIELIRRQAGGTAFALTTPLLTTAAGHKMGKTAQGALWLAGSPYEYWQFWRNVDDADIKRFLCLFTELPADEIARLTVLQGEERNEAKKQLANEATTLLYGPQAAQKAQESARVTFEEGGSGTALPTLTLSPANVRKKPGLLSLCVQSGLAASHSEARRLVRQGGLRLNGNPVTQEDQRLTPQDIQNGSAKLSVGKKRHALLKTP